jgi:NAD(P)-dependent dehydrogenase (short-subunit alcohol dehydrogenase family)
MRGRLEGRVALITGGGGEIGSAIARRFAAEGAVVAISDVEPAKAEATARSLVEAGGQASGFAVDVASEASAEEAVKRTIAAFGRLTTLVNVAAAVTPDGTVETLSLAQWNHAIGVNLTGAFLMCQRALPHLIKVRGAIINTASVAGLKSHPYCAAYCASKGGVVMLTKALAAEYGRKEVRINCLCPGGIETPMLSQFQLPDGVPQAALMRIAPLGRHGQAEEVAGTIAFLASDDATYINGATIVVDGGMIA